MGNPKDSLGGAGLPSAEAASNTDVADSVKRLEDVLAPYGYYLSEEGEENSLRLGFTELGALALGILVWGVTEYAKALLSELAKKKFKRIFGNDKPDIEELQTQLKEVLQELQAAKTQLDSSAKILDMISEERLAEQLRDAGFSLRGAKAASIEVKPALATEIAQLVKGNPVDSP